MRVVQFLEAGRLSVYLFEIASQKANWLSARQTALANNVANANTPGYRAIDLKPFSAMLADGGLTMGATGPELGATAIDFKPVLQNDADGAEETLSGNTVNLERQMIKLGDVSRDFSMTANIHRAFHQLILSALK